MLFGTVNGDIVSDSHHYVNLEKVSIMNIKASRNFIVYSTAEGVLKKISREDLNTLLKGSTIFQDGLDSKQSININKFVAGAPVIYFNFIDS